MTKTILDIYNLLLKHYKNQNWWPADTQFEVIIGAILTQNTSWNNVTKAISNLKKNDLLEPKKLYNTKPEIIEYLIKPSGFYKQKTLKIINFLNFFANYKFNFDLLKNEKNLRDLLLKIKGIGPETADSILLYALNLPYFVVDSYTKRVMFRLGVTKKENIDYASLQTIFHNSLPLDIEIYKEYHALIVEHSKKHCKKIPACNGCPLNLTCVYIKGYRKFYELQ
ncbi:MAG: endonuclease [Proteobacteria bacterium]|nr:endonuclease [Pseudomonadota bacterium]